MNSPFTARAQEDLIEIWHSIAQDNPAAADAVIHDLRGHAMLLREHPTFGDVIRRHGRRIRATAMGNYVLYYRFEERRIVIVRVLHGARDFRRLIDE